MKILIVAAHPDDEVLGCGGMVARFSTVHDFYCLFLGEGAMSRDNSSIEQVRELKESAQKAGGILGIKRMKFCSFPDNMFDSKPLLNIIKTIESYVADEIRSLDLVFTHFPYDLNVDHRITSQAVQTAFRPNDGIPCKGVYFFEVLGNTGKLASSMDFRPNAYVDITNTILKKIQAFECYGSEIRHPRSGIGIRDMASFRGAESGMFAAEAYMQHFFRR